MSDIDFSLVQDLDKFFNSFIRFDRSLVLDGVKFYPNKLYPYRADGRDFCILDDNRVRHTLDLLHDNPRNSNAFLINKAGYHVLSRGRKRNLEYADRVVVLKNGVAYKGKIEKVLEDKFVVSYRYLTDKWRPEQQTLSEDRIAHFEDYCSIVDRGTNEAVFSYSDEYLTQHRRAYDLVEIEENHATTRTS